MAQQHTPAAIVAPLKTGQQTHFLAHTSEFLKTLLPGAEMGSRGVDHSVLVFDKDGIEDHPVVLCLSDGPFSFQEYLTADEARALAHALLMAASFTERSSLDKAVDAAMQAAEVAA